MAYSIVFMQLIFLPENLGGGSSSILELRVYICPRHLGIGLALKDSAGEFFVDAAPLFEKEWHVGGEALVADIDDPFGVHRSSAWAGFAANDDLVDAFEVYIGNRTQKRFERQEFHSRWNLP